MTNKFIPALCACLLSVTALALGICAEDYEDAPVEEYRGVPQKIVNEIRDNLVLSLVESNIL